MNGKKVAHRRGLYSLLQKVINNFDPDKGSFCSVGRFLHLYFYD